MCDKKIPLDIPALIRRLLLSWLLATTIEYATNMGPLQDLSTLTQMSFIRVCLLTAVFLCILLFIGKYLPVVFEQMVIMLCFIGLTILSLITSYTISLLLISLLVIGVLIWYTIRGWNSATIIYDPPPQKSHFWFLVTGILALLFFILVGLWTAYRVTTFSTPTYDFGIFSQMFHSMKETGLPITTVERDGMLSHFRVHVSPIYYLLLPLYCVFPYPVTLQILQAAVLASAVIPLWLLGKHHNLPPVMRTLLCLLLLLYPAYSGGTSYDIHENAFLTPLVLWLMYAVDRENIVLTGIFAVLTLMIKEDSAVYTAIIGLFVFVRAALKPKAFRELMSGLGVLILSIIWFFCTTGFLAKYGDGVMTYRYDNFMYDGSSSLITVIKAVLMCPFKALLECVDSEKIKFIAQTMLPLIGLPLLTRRYERYLLLIPYILVNLMSDYQYQHDIFFQYTYGSTALLFYLTVTNLADFKLNISRYTVLSTAVTLSLVIVLNAVVPKATPYFHNQREYRDYYNQIRQTLDVIPDDASVGATTFYTTYLSQRDVLYDVRYASTEHLLSCEYIALSVTGTSCYKAYAGNSENGFDNFVQLLCDNGYTLCAEMDGVIVVYKKA